MSKYAYVTVMYGNNVYLTGAIVMGYTLMKTKTEYDRVIMLTPDVSDEYRNYLKKVYTHLIDIDYLKVNPEIFLEEETRFRDVFTKLRCFELVQYEKIIILDLDMIISQNIDHLFKLDPPAAVLKRFHVTYGKKIDKNMMCRDGRLINTINAGLMLLKPNLEELAKIQEDLLSNEQLNKFKYPEQDYLSLRYCGDWTSITFGYNFQFGLTRRVKKAKLKMNQIFVIHYSSSYKPWNDLILGRVITDDELKFKEQHKKYYDLWLSIYQKIKEEYEKNEIILPY